MSFISENLKHFPPVVPAPPPTEFERMISAAWRVPRITPAQVTTLVTIKRAYHSAVGVGLSDDELAWLTKLARKGGWRPTKRKTVQHA